VAALFIATGHSTSLVIQWHEVGFHLESSKPIWPIITLLMSMFTLWHKEFE